MSEKTDIPENARKISNIDDFRSMCELSICEGQKKKAEDVSLRPNATTYLCLIPAIEKQLKWF